MEEAYCIPCGAWLFLEKTIWFCALIWQLKLLHFFFFFQAGKLATWEHSFRYQFCQRYDWYQRYDVSGFRNIVSSSSTAFKYVIRIANHTVYSETPLKRRFIWLIETSYRHIHIFSASSMKEVCLCERLMCKIPLSVYHPPPRMFNVYSLIKCYKEKIIFYAHRQEHGFHKFELVKNLGNTEKQEKNSCCLCLGFGDFWCFPVGIAHYLFSLSSVLGTSRNLAF